MAENKLENTFRADTKMFINQINEGLIKLENEGYSTDVINHIFRCIHSVKSEAAYLNYDDIASEAHKIESVIEPLRNIGANVEVDPQTISFCFSTLDLITELNEKEDKSNASAELLDVQNEADEADIQDYNDTVPLDEIRPFTEIELELMKDSRLRREKLYRVHLSVSEEESLLYARIYLAISNLEKNLTVINTNPTLDDLELNPVNNITITVAAAYGEDEIAKYLDIDQVKNIKISRLDYEEELKNLPLITDEDEITPIPVKEKIINVEADEIDALSNYVNEIKKRLNDLSSDAIGSKDFEGLENISDSIGKMMENLKTVDFNNHFFGFKRNVRDIAARLGKKAELIFAGNNVRIEREFADFVAEPVLQLLRNAVVHGIEMPEERRAAGKNEVGAIRLNYISDDEGQIFEISDDGRGISPGIASETDSILDTIIKPGFTTLERSAEFAGRGVGLDLVMNKITSRGGIIELENRPSEGCLFRLVFKDTQKAKNIFVNEYNETTFAVLSDTDEGLVMLHSEDFTKSENTVYYKNLPVADINGLLQEIPASDEKGVQAVKIKNSAKQAYLIIGESLFEMTYSSELPEKGEKAGPYLYKFKIEKEAFEYPLLDTRELLESF